MIYIPAPWIVRLTTGAVLTGAEVYYLINQPTATVETVNIQLIVPLYSDSTGAVTVTNPVATDGMGNANTGYSAIQPYIPVGAYTIAIVYNGQVISCDVDQQYGLTYLPGPTLTTLGGVYSTMATPHEWVDSISDTGAPNISQPAFSDISGNIAMNQINSGIGADGSTFLRGDNIWASPIGNGDVVGPVTSVQGDYAIYNSSIGTIIADGGAQPGYRNMLINGGMDIDQRNNYASQTFASGSPLAYACDRWYVQSLAGGSGASGQVTNAALNNGFAYFQHGYTIYPNGSGAIFGQRIEQARLAHLFFNTPVTLGLWMKTSSAPVTITWVAYVPTIINNFTSRTQIATGTFSIGSSWTFNTAALNLGNAFNLGLEIDFSIPTMGGGAWVEFTGVQLEASPVATPFERMSPRASLQECQRYYQVIGVGNSANLWGCTAAYAPSTVAMFPISFLTMRSAPSLAYTVAGGGGITSTFGGSLWGAPTLAAFSAAPSYMLVQSTHTGGSGSIAMLEEVTLMLSAEL